MNWVALGAGTVLLLGAAVGGPAGLFALGPLGLLFICAAVAEWSEAREAAP